MSTRLKKTRRHSGSPGKNPVTFPSSARRALKRGHGYELVLVSRAAGQTSKTATKTFKIS